MTRCTESGCYRRPITNGAYCDEHTRAHMTDAFAPEWVRRAKERRLSVRVQYAA